MKRLTYLVVAAALILTSPALAQTPDQPAQSAQTSGATVNKGPLFLGGVVNRLKKSLSREKVEPAPLAPQQRQQASASAVSTSSGVQTSAWKLQVDAQNAANRARNRQVSAFLRQNADKKMAQRMADINAAKAADAAAAGQPVPGAVPGAVAVPPGTQPGAVAPVQMIYQKQDESPGPKPIFNNYR